MPGRDTPPLKADKAGTHRVARDDDFWAQPANISKRPGRVHAVFIKLLRYVLPLAAVGVVVLLMAWPSLEQQPVDVAEAPPTTQAMGQNELLNPRFESEDSRKQPFTIIADRAVQTVDNPDVIELENPEAEIELNSGDRMTAAALTGLYTQDREQLLLKGGVQFTHGMGYKMNTDEILLNLDSGRAWADTPVQAAGPAGTLAATGLSVKAEGESLIFTGPAKLVLYDALEGIGNDGF